MKYSFVKIILLSFILVSSKYLYSQAGFTSASPTGGLNEFYRFIALNLQYPSEARRAGISGKVVVQFTIDSTGQILNPMAIEGPKYGMDKEAVRLISLSPAWNPAVRDGKPVQSNFKMPINFSLPQFSIASVEDIIKIKPEITKLDFSGIGLNELSHRINELYNLRKIDLHNNDLKDLPESLEKIQFLKEIDISGNKFEAIPGVIENCKNLIKLNLEGNAVKDVPVKLFFLPKLKELNLSNNPITSLPDDISNSTIKKLILSSTLISEKDQTKIIQSMPNTKVIF